MKHLVEKAIDYMIEKIQELVTYVKERRRKNSESVCKAFDDVSSYVCGYEAYDELVLACRNRDAALAKKCAYNLKDIAIFYIWNASIPSHKAANNALWYHTKQYMRFIDSLDLSSNESDYSSLQEEFRIMRLHLQDMVFYEMKMKLRLARDYNDLAVWITRYTPNLA